MEYHIEQNQKFIYNPKAECTCCGTILNDGDCFTHMRYRNGDEIETITNGKIHIKSPDKIILEDHHRFEITVKLDDIISWHTAAKFFE